MITKDFHRFIAPYRASSVRCVTEGDVTGILCFGVSYLCGVIGSLVSLLQKLSKLTAEAYKAYGRCVIKLIAKALVGVLENLSLALDDKCEQFLIFNF